MPRFSHARTVLFQEVDAAGVVFFARFFEWFHDAYVAWFASRGIDFTDVLSQGEWGLPLAHAEADFKAPLTFGAQVRVELERFTLSEQSLAIDYAVRGPMGTHATGRTVHVFIDRKSFRPQPVPEAVRRALALPDKSE